MVGLVVLHHCFLCGPCWSQTPPRSPCLLPRELGLKSVLLPCSSLLWYFWLRGQKWWQPYTCGWREQGSVDPQCWCKLASKAAGTFQRHCTLFWPEHTSASGNLVSPDLSGYYGHEAESSSSCSVWECPSSFSVLMPSYYAQAGRSSMAQDCHSRFSLLCQ